MTKVEILSGNFSTGVDVNGAAKKGNFNGYDDDGVRHFIAKRIMEGQGWLKNEDVKYPFWVKADVKQIGQLDANGDPLTSNGVPVTVDRLQVVSLFKTREALIESFVNKASIDIEIQAGIHVRASEAGLTKETIAQLLAVAI